MNTNRGRNIVIGTLLAAVAIMAVGYAALAQTLTINGTAEIGATWDVRITAISPGTPTNGATNASSPTFNATSAKFSTNLTVPGSKMVYTIKVRNNGTLNARLTDLTTNPSTTASSGIYYKVTGVTENTTTIAPGGTNTVTVEVGWNASDTTMPTTKTVPLTVSLTYTQY